MSKQKTKVTVSQTPGDEVSTEILATAIRDIAEGVRKLTTTRLNRRAILVLIKDATHIDKCVAERVLNCLEQLDQLYCK